MIICPIHMGDCPRTIPPAPRTGFLIISSEENNSQIRKTIDDCFISNNLYLKDAMNIKRTGDLFCKICEQILSSAFGVALITHNTPGNALKNIFLEIGWMLAFGKEVIILTDDIDIIPSDLKGKEVFNISNNTELMNSVNKWNENISETISYWKTLAEISINAEDYEWAYEYLKRAVMFGDYDDGLSELKRIRDQALKEEIYIPKRLNEDIRNFVTFIDSQLKY